MNKIRVITPGLQIQCESERFGRYAAGWERQHPDKQCTHYAKYEINGRYLCQRHASLEALKLLLEENQNGT